MDTEHVKQLLKDEESSMKKTIEDGLQNVEDQIDQVRDVVQKYNEKVVALVTEKPFVAIGASFAVGFVVGKLARYRWFV